MAEENGDKAIAPEDIALYSGDVMMHVESPVEEACDKTDNIMYPRKMEPVIIDEEETDKLADETTDAAIEEEDEYLGGNSDATEAMHVKQSPTKETDSAASQPRRSPALVIVGSNHKFNVHSRYLSDSVGSCHDYCKYGHKHESEKKSKRLMLRTIREAQPLKGTTSDDMENCVQEKVAKKKELNQRLSLPGSKSENPPLMRMEDNNLSKKGVNQSKMKLILSEIKQSSVPSPGSASRSKTDIQVVRKTVNRSPNMQEKLNQKVKEMKTRKQAGSCNEGEKEVKAEEQRSSSPGTSLKKEAAYNKGEKEIKAKEPISYSPKTPLKKSPSFKARIYKDHKIFSRSKTQINPEEAKVDGVNDIPEKTLHMIEPHISMKPAEKTSKSTLGGESPRSTPGATHTGKTQGSKGNRKGSGVSTLSSSSHESSRPRRAKQQGAEATKNTQIGIKTEDGGSKTRTPRAKPIASRKMKNLDLKNTKQIDTIREDGRSKTNALRAKSIADSKWRPKRTEKSLSEEKDNSAWKVKFKRGTVVALQVANNAPKKLRFKRARVLGEDQNVKAVGDRKLKSEYDMGNEKHDIKPGLEKVSLRHQEAAEKKDDVDLNNVIEETASKLVKARKSKVKALVGAFETVMSLGDLKRLVETNAS